jgi:hypothetical protein
MIAIDSSQPFDIAQGKFLTLHLRVGITEVSKFCVRFDPTPGGDEKNFRAATFD